MRDILVALLVLVVAVGALRKPWMGVVASACISVMSPHVILGYAAASWPVAAVVAVCTLGGMLASEDKQSPLLGPPVGFFLAFWLWICLTLPFSLYFTDSLPLWERSMKIFLLVAMTLILITDRAKLEWLLWVLVLSLGFYGVKGGLFTLATGGQYRVWGPGGFIEGNNELATALVATIPLMRYLHLRVQEPWSSSHRLHRWQPWLRWAMLAMMALTGITALGSQSRGALVAMAAMGAMLWAKTDKHKITWAFVLACAGIAGLSFMPAQWWQRMETIRSYEQDGSALGRINAWWNAWYLALDRLMGGGFQVYTAEVFARYAPDPTDVHAAHSIYFQVLGEHGFVGLFIFVGIGASTWWTCRKLIKIGAANPALRWASELGSMLQVSIIGFATGGAFLSLAYFDLPYYQMALAVLALSIAKRQGAMQAPARDNLHPGIAVAGKMAR